MIPEQPGKAYLFAPTPAAQVRQQRPFVVFAGRVTASKGVETLVRVAAMIPEVDCRIVGDGDLRATLEARYAGHANISFTGPMPQSDLIAHYRDAAAIVFPSIAPETFGLGIVEAAACGTPTIVAGASGGAQEIVAATKGGLVYETDEALAAAIRRLAFDAGLRGQLGILARAGFEARYTQQIHLKAYLGHVDEILGRTGTACAR